MIEKLNEIFRSDEFIPTSALFPTIDEARLAKDLNLEVLGARRGKSELPESATLQPDHVEMRVISRVEDLRRKGLENFEINRRVYSERLGKAVSAKVLLEIEASDVKARFVEEVTKWRALMVTPRERVQEAYRWRTHFRKVNNLDLRPAKPAASWGGIIGIAFLMILVESTANAYLFSQNNPLGILGGLLAAILVSVGNVAMSTALGMWTRFVNIDGLRNIHKKFFGFFSVLIWIAFAFWYNAAIAHFRDAVETTSEWRKAGETAIQMLWENPAKLNTLESYVLFILGFLISVASLVKGYNSFDPYPGYSKVSKEVIDAREHYIEYLEESIEMLAEHRDEAFETLHRARGEVERQVRDSVDALYGQKALISNLSPFLTQCDLVVNYLLSVYRDANKLSRESDSPAHFQEKFAFDKFSPPLADDDRRIEAEKQVEDASKLVETSTRDIFEIFHSAMKDHYEIDELEKNYVERSARQRPPAADVLTSDVMTTEMSSKEKSNGEI